MEVKASVATLLSHPTWFVCSLALSVVLLTRRRLKWSPRTCPVDLSGKTAIVTGANTGLGKQIALDLARRNARTILACRSKERGQAAVEEIRKASGNPNVQLRILDVSSMGSVREFAQHFLEEERQLHLLVNNAGVSGVPFTITAEGLDLMFATNVLGPFLLTNLLLDCMKASAPARIVNVSSFRHQSGVVNVKHLTGEERPRNFDHAYSCTKLMNIVFTMELARRLQGTAVTVNAQNPGVVQTDIMRHFNWMVRLLFRIAGLFFFKSAEEGALSTLYCAVSKEAEGITGKYFDSDCNLKLPVALAQDPAIGRKLWEASEKLVGLADGGSQH